ncbi:MAG: right-handed parallel beta-helix repeat-containing protein, partial [Verrucomicrobiota bacterium]|nr:right-handed parallel beta-helix repeat-containing protein [Verrucomicrobiota bacterium]
IRGDYALSAFTGKSGLDQMAWARGRLTPPGAPAPIMKTLDEVEPRAPITSLPFTITNAGAYYLTASLTSTGHGVVVQSGQVTVDLMGFAITGDRGSGDYGVSICGTTGSAVENVVVRNGTIRRFDDGVRMEYVRYGRLENLQVMTNSWRGIYLRGAHGEGLCSQYRIEGCVSADNSGCGIYLDGYNTGQCNDNAFVGCTIRNNGDRGIYLDGDTSGRCNGNLVANCTISENHAEGIVLYGNAGQCAANRVGDCIVRANVGTGIRVNFANGNRLEGNHVAEQTGTTTCGIRSLNSSQNVISRNTCVGQTTNYVFSANDTYGPIVTNVGALPASGDGAHPWGNFSR